MLLNRFFFLVFMSLSAMRITAQPAQQEANLKAAFIFNFTKYIEWNTNVQDIFVIGVLGKSPIVEPLNEIARTNTIKNKTIVVRVLNRPEEVASCNILFIPRGCPFPLQPILDHAGTGVLTISEQPGMARHGTAFNFIIRNNQLKFEANLKAISSAGLKAGSQLLKLAIIVG